MLECSQSVWTGECAYVIHRPSSLELRRQAVQLLGVRFLVHVTPENLLRALKRKLHDIGTQLLTRLIHLLLHFGFRRSQHALTFGTAIAFRIVDDLVTALVCQSENLLCLVLGLADDLDRALLGKLLLVPSTFAGRKSIGDPGLAIVHRLHDVRPDELQAEPHEYDERDGLPKQCQVDIHGSPLILSPLILSPLNV